MSRETFAAQTGNIAQIVPEIVWAAVPGSDGRIVGATVGKTLTKRVGRKT